MAAGNVPGNVPGTRPPDGKMPLRFIPAGVMAPVLHPSMVFEPLINACGPHPTTLMILSPAGLVITWVDAVPVVIDVTIVDRGMVITGNP